MRYLLWLACMLAAATSLADIPYRVDEQVEVNTFFTKWTAGRVIEVNRARNVLCEYTSPFGLKRDWFTPNNIRRPYERDSLCRARMWKDTEGKFSVIAVALRVDDTKVVLRTEDSEKVEVPLEKLSTIDRAFLKRLIKATGGYTATGSHRGDTVTFDASSVVEVQPSSSAHLSLAPDPLRSSLTLSEGGSAFEVGNAFDKIGAIIPLGGSDQWLLASLESSAGSEKSKLPTRLMWVSVKKSKMSRMHPLSPGVRLKDYYAPLKLALTHDPHSPKPVLSLWKSEPGIEHGKLILSWYGSEITQRTSDASWARFASDRIVVFRDSKRNLIAWDFRDRKGVWSTVQESAGAPAPQLTAGRRYLLVPESNRLRVIDPIAGQELQTIPVDGEIHSLSIADDGHHVVALLESSLIGLDLSSPDELKRVDVGSLDLPKTTTVQWLNQDVICLSTTDKEMLLFSLDRGIPLWRYEVDGGASYRNQGDDRVRRTLGSHLVYAATATAKKGNRTQRGIAVGAVKLPGEDASGFVKYLERDELVVFEGDQSVRIEVDALQDADAIRQTMTEQVEANGWTIDENSPNVVLAKLEKLPPIQVQYRTSGSGGLFPPITPPRITPPRIGIPGSSRGTPPSSWPFGSGQREAPKIMTASVQPFLSSITLSIDGQPAWIAHSSVGVPTSMILREGDSLQERIDATQSPDVEFFRERDIPEAIINPAFREGLGTSLITNRGLQEKSKPN